MPRPTKPQTHQVDPQTGCWIWQGGVNSLGYGRVTMTKQYAHRIYYERHKGPIPAGYDVDHLCRNPRCCNPEHLEAVTHAENIRRGKLGKLSTAELEAAREKYRTSDISVRQLAAECGITDSHMSRLLAPVRKPQRPKLTSAQAQNIRAEYSTGTISTRKLGAKFGVSGNTVSTIVRGITHAGAM